MSNFIYSTLAAGVDYAFYNKTPDGRQIKHKHISVKGGAGVATRRINEAGEIITPNGVVTKVSDEELSLLESHDHFKQHVEAGYITVEKKNIKVDKVVENMKKRDVSAPKTPSDFARPPKTGPIAEV